MTNRRDFLKKSGTALGAFAALNQIPVLRPGAVPGFLHSGAPLAYIPTDDEINALMATALGAAKSAGASYSDVRIGRYQNNFVITREHQIVQVVDTDSMGAGVRALVDGTWGFAATRNLTSDSLAAAAREAVAIAKANRIAQDRPVVLAPTPVVQATWNNGFTKDPWDVPVEEKADLLIRANTEAMKAKNVRFVSSVMYFVKENRHFASTDGSVTNQTLVRSWVPMQITAIAADQTDFQNRANTVQPMGRGCEYVARGRHRQQRTEVGRGSGREAHGKAGRCRPLRSRAASVASLAHDPRIDRTSDRARSRDGLRGELRRHQLRRRRRKRCSASSSTARSS